MALFAQNDFNLDIGWADCIKAEFLDGRTVKLSYDRPMWCWVGLKEPYLNGAICDLYLPKSCRAIRGAVFQNSAYLNRVVCFGNIEEIQNAAFENCGVKELIIKGNAHKLRIDDEAFGNSAIEYIEMPYTTDIANDAFFATNKLKTVYMRNAPALALNDNFDVFPSNPTIVGMMKIDENGHFA